MKKLKVQILLLLLFATTLSLAQDNWTNLITPQKIHEIYEIDSKLYCATEGGLVIYNQTTQTVERQLITDDIPSHRVEDITQDATNNIWIGTYDNGLARMTDDGWEKLPIEHNFSSAPLNYCIEYDDNGTLWVGTSSGLFKYENETWTKDSNSPDPVWDMEKDDQGIIHTGGTVPGKLENGVLTEYDYLEHGFGNTYRFSHIDYGPNGSFYWASGETEVVIYDGTTWTVYTRDDIGAFNTPGGQDPTDIIYTATGEVWVAFLLNGIFKFDGNNWEHVYATEDPEHIQFIETSNGDFIISIDDVLYEYDNGFNELANLSIEFGGNNVKIAPNEQGEMLVLHNDQLLKYDTELNTTLLTILPEVDDYSILDFLHHPDGSIGFIDTDSGDTYYNGQVQVNIPAGFISNVNDYIIDSYENYWIATSNGIIRNNQGAITIYDENNTPFPAGNSANFETVIEAPNGDIWAGTREVLARWERATQTWVEFHELPDLNNYPTCLFIDEDNTMWAGYGNLFGNSIPALARLDGDTWTLYDTENSNIESIIVSDIRQIDGQLLFATQAGMSIFDGTDFTNFNRDNSDIGSAYCNKIEADGQGNIWIASEIGGSTGHGGISIYKGSITNTQEANENTPTPIHLFPNPAKAFFQIDMEEIPVHIQVFDLTGRLVKTVNNSPIVHTDDMPSGMYAVLIQTDERQYAGKILIANN